MFQYEYLVYTPAFYFLVAFTLALTFGYIFGRRFNRRVVMTALDPLVQVFNARDQQFTNIGGQTGYHANIVPGNMRSVRRIDTTLTILPRQSLLYLPISLLIRRFDRMQTFFVFNKRGTVIREEAHLIDSRFEKMMGNRIENAASLNREDVVWGGRKFHLYSASPVSRKWIQNLMNRMGQVDTVRHAGVIPGEERAYLFLIPKVGTVADRMTEFRDWLEETAHAASGRHAEGAESGGGGDA
ncbi:MAG: hypothetical protein WCY01_00270 [Alkalispirochaeta sp.]